MQNFHNISIRLKLKTNVQSKLAFFTTTSILNFFLYFTVWCAIDAFACIDASEWECVDRNEGKENRESGKGELGTRWNETRAMMVAAEKFLSAMLMRHMDEFSMKLASKVRRYSWEFYHAV